MECLGIPPLVGISEAVNALRQQIARVAPTDFGILIEGETGTGKELVAHHLHAASRRHGGPFVAVNCAALVESLLEAELFGIEHGIATGVRSRQGRFEQAHHGTLFLDEVADLSAPAQAKLLRVLQDFCVERVGSQLTRRISVRVIAATNRPLPTLVAQGSFRADLFYRLNAIDLHILPLRQRQADIVPLIHHFLHGHGINADCALSPEAVEALVWHSWPGNVRELQRVLERAVALGGGQRIELNDLPAALVGKRQANGPDRPADDLTLAMWSSRFARLVFEQAGRNKRRACRRLNISYHTLQRHLRVTSN